MKYALIAILLSGCSAMPTMKYCETVWYSREKEKVHIEADCTVPVGKRIPGLM
jgi:hypothetical protein